MSTETKTKLKKVGLFSYLGITTLLSILFIVLCVVAGVNNSKTNRSNNSVPTSKNEVVEVQHRNKVQPKYASYDDSNYTISLSLEEVNGDFVNLSTYLSDNRSSITSYYLSNFNFVYNNVSYGSSGYTVSFTSSALEGVSSGFDSIKLDFTTHKFAITNQGQASNFEYGINIVLNANSYEGFKSAIEEDLKVPNVNDNIFETLTSSVVSFIGSLSSGIVAITSVFYSNDSLTVIGLLSVIVVAVSLAYFLFRLLIGLIRMRG